MLTSCLSGTRKASLSCDEIRKPNRTVFGLKPGRRLFGPSGKQEEGLQRNKLNNAKKKQKGKKRNPFENLKDSSEVKTQWLYSFFGN